MLRRENKDIVPAQHPPLGYTVNGERPMKPFIEDGMQIPFSVDEHVLGLGTTAFVHGGILDLQRRRAFHEGVSWATMDI